MKDVIALSGSDDLLLQSHPGGFELRGCGPESESGGLLCAPFQTLQRIDPR
jgi:hypothetical protein